MADDDLQVELRRFTEANHFRGKGPLCLALVVTQHAKNKGLPLDPDSLVTARGGQVTGLGRSAVQSVLKRYRIERVLASEGGRTSRGSLGNMRVYVAFLNQMGDEVDLDAIEAYWIGEVKAFFAAHPFKIKFDSSRGLRSVVRDVVKQAINRQKDFGGTSYAGAVLQHLVGAKLDCALGKGTLEHNSYSTADAPGRRAGDFLVGDVVIHVTTSPTDPLIDRCCDNLDDGYRPMLVTSDYGVTYAHGLAKMRGIEERVDIFEVEQFVALNLYEFARFEADGRRTALADLVIRYNNIVDACETDPSLKIQLKR